MYDVYPNYTLKSKETDGLYFSFLNTYDKEMDSDNSFDIRQIVSTFSATQEHI